MVGVVLSVGDDDVIHEVDTHQFTSAFDASCQFIVGPAGTEVARGMVVTDGEDGAVGENGLLHDDTDIDGGLSDTPVGDAYFLDEMVMLVHKKYPELLYVKVACDYRCGLPCRGQAVLLQFLPADACPVRRLPGC